MDLLLRGGAMRLFSYSYESVIVWERKYLHKFNFDQRGAGMQNFYIWNTGATQNLNIYALKYLTCPT